MPVNDTMQRVGERAIEAGLFLPLGVYDRISGAVTDVDTRTLRNLVEDFVGRGQAVMAPVEARVRTRGRQIRTGGRQAREAVLASTARTSRSATNRAKSAGEQATMATPRVSIPARSDLAIRRYDQLTVDELAARLDGLTNTELAKIYKYEAVHEKRSTVLNAIESKMADLPIATYDALTVSQVRSRIKRMGKVNLEKIRSYEAGTKKRKTVLKAIDGKLSA